MVDGIFGRFGEFGCFVIGFVGEVVGFGMVFGNVIIYCWKMVVFGVLDFILEKILDCVY